MTKCETPSPYYVHVVVVMCALRSTAPRTKHKLCNVGFEDKCSWSWATSPPLSLPQPYSTLHAWQQAALSPRGSTHAQLHPRCQTLSICQLEYHPDAGFSPFLPLCQEGQEHSATSPSTCQGLWGIPSSFGFMHRGREPGAAWASPFSVPLCPFSSGKAFGPLSSYVIQRSLPCHEPNTGATYSAPPLQGL